MTFTFFIYVFLFVPPFIIAPKLLTRDLKICSKETIYLVVGGILAKVITAISRNFYTESIFIVVASGILIILFFFLYFFKIKKYSAKKAFILTSISNFLIGIIETLWFPLLEFFYTTPSPSRVSFFHFLWSIPYVITSIAIVSLFVKATKKLRRTIHGNDKMQTFLLLAFALFFILNMIIFVLIETVFGFSRALTNIWLFIGYNISYWYNVLFIIVASSVFVILYFYARHTEARMIVRQKEVEQKILQYYTAQIEQSYSAQRGFTHDVSNVFASLSGYIYDEDLAGLTRYYKSSVEPAFAIITKNDFTLEGLRKIMPQEIKSTLAIKLMTAQNLGIDTTFEATEEIDHVPIDSMVLVRMLGIIMDNAIEELTAMGEGQLMVAVYKLGDGTTFVVKNTCRADTPPLHELERVGYSTKGEGRGIGLSNLSEMVAGQSKGVTIQTSIVEGNFIQKLRIGGAE
ncbi:MAG: GHKL domain-containing protein [Defluviitaleaceae bacterium]|nr:GHKL domain-containing protein [Defluviitaleaceae bacterium]